MKTYRFIYFVAASSLLFAACSREAVAPEENLTPGENTGGTYPVYFGAEATLNDAAAGDDITAGTRVSLTPDANDSSFEASWDYLDKGSIQYSCNDDNFSLTDTFKDATWNGKSFTVYFDYDNTTKESNWKYTLIYPHLSKFTSGQNRVQEGSKYNSEYDLMIGNASVTSALPGKKDDEGNPIVFNMLRETGIAYFHIKSNLGEDETLVSATLTVDGGTKPIAYKEVSLERETDFSKGFKYSGDEYNSINLTFKEGTAPSANDFKLWFNVLPTTYNSSTLEIETTAHKLTLKKKTGTYSYIEQKLYKVTGTVSDDKWVAFPNAINFATVFGGTLSADCSEAEIGTTVTLKATANKDYYFNNDWSVTGKNGNTVEVNAGTFIMPAYPVTVTGTFTKQSGEVDNSINLTDGGKIANCYIVPPTADLKYKFQTSNSGGSVDNVTSCEVLWESFGTSTAPKVGDLVKNVSYSDGYISFTTTGKAGNALIAAKNAEDVILWSWHIWITGAVDDITYPNSAGVMMDRNLGAISNEPDNSLAIGLLYQWGRKDPFMGSSEYSAFTVAKTSNDLIFSFADGGSNTTMNDAIQNPTKFYKASGSHWQNGEKGWSDDKKTIYDPCPAGYRVPKSEFYTTALVSQSFAVSSNGVYYSADKNEIWFPMAGDRKYNDSYEYLASRGLYWTTTLKSGDSYIYFRVRSSGFSTYQIYSAQGNSVRCQKM